MRCIQFVLPSLLVNSEMKFHLSTFKTLGAFLRTISQAHSAILLWHVCESRRMTLGKWDQDETRVYHRSRLLRMLFFIWMFMPRPENERAISLRYNRLWSATASMQHRPCPHRDASINFNTSTVGMVFARRSAVPGFLQTWCLAFRPKSSIFVSSDQII